MMSNKHENILNYDSTPNPPRSLAARLLACIALVFGFLPIVLVVAALSQRGNPFPYVLLVIIILMVVFSILGLIASVSARILATKAGDKQARRIATTGVVVSAFWPVALVLIIGGSWLSAVSEAKYQIESLESTANALVSEYSAEAEKSGAYPVDVFPQQFAYFGESLKTSASFKSLSGKVIILVSTDLPRTKGRVMGFADGSARFVPPKQLATVLRQDDIARKQTQNKRIKVYLRDYMGVREN